MIDIIYAISIIIFFIGGIKIGEDDDPCDCEACTSGYTGGRTQEYAEKYPTCKRNIYNQE